MDLLQFNHLLGEEERLIQDTVRTFVQEKVKGAAGTDVKEN
jgi:hypothetical protein